ncbi:MAG: heat-inducible transcriptional repressor HrcA [Candidatus Wallbacteria bacterium]|nr:heat-inducible transcriptional repressor HrcA [Candidatus Wallbacteria bacterium]
MQNEKDKNIPSSLTERQKRILKEIIDEYISGAEPIASRDLAKPGRISFSSATIRNEMMELEDQGYLTQPHTSAGRIPTPQAYRFYIDYLMELEELTREEEKKIEEIRKEYESKRQKIKEVLKNASHLLTEITSLPGLSLMPTFSRTLFKKLQMVTLGEGKILLLLLTREGLVENLIIKIDSEISQERLEVLSQRLNQKPGFCLAELKTEIELIFHEEQEHYQRALQNIASALSDKIEGLGNQEIMFEGASSMMKLPEFQDTKKLEMIFKLIEEKEELIKLLNDCITSEGVQVIIGNERNAEKFRDLTFISAPFRVSPNTCGSIGIIGPNRIQYGRIITAVSEISKKLSEILEKL